MAKNIGYLTSKRTVESDEVYTPDYVVNAIAKYIPKTNTRILCPFDKDEHAFPKVLKKMGYDVVNTHFDPTTCIGTNFFDYIPEGMKKMGITHIISNPPFSIKDCVLEHCEKLDVSYALLLPLPTLQSNRRFKNVFSKGNTQALIFDKRIGYGTKDKPWEEIGMTNHFASIFICKGILPSPLIFDNLLSCD